MPRIQVGDVQLNYVDSGKGDVLLFVPGLIGLAKVWEIQFPEFSKHYRCVSFDHRGSGESEKTESGYNTGQIARDAVGLLDALDIKQANVVGASTGGCILQNLCLDYPDRVKNAVFTNTWTKADEYMRRLQTTRRQILHAYGTGAYIETSSLWTGGPTMFRNNFERMLELEQTQKKTIADPDILTARIDMTLEHDRFDEIKNIKHRTLIIAAKDDPLTPPYYAEDLHGFISSSEYVLLEYGGHNSYRRNSDGWNSAVEEFLAGDS